MRPAVSYAAFTAVIAAIALLDSPYLTNLAIIVLLHAIPAIGLALLLGYTGQISLGQAGFYGLGAYASSLISMSWGLSPFLAAPMAAMVVGLVGWLLGWIIFRLHGHHLAIATLGFGIIVHVVLVELRQYTGGPVGLIGIPPFRVFGLALSSDAAFLPVAAASCLGVVAMATNLVRSPFGFTMRGVADNERAAASVGIDVARTKRNILVLSAVVSSFAGSLYAHYIGFISPAPFNVAFSIRLLLMVAVGGFSGVWGVLFGVAFVSIITEPLQELGYLDVVVYGLLLIVISIYFPRGLVNGLVHGAAGRMAAAGTLAEGQGLGRMLEVEDVSRRFGALVAVDQVSFRVGPGELVALIGPNGAGKSTLLDLLAGSQIPSSGRIRFAGRRLSGVAPHRVNALGIARTFQQIELFGSMSVRDNVVAGGAVRGGATLLPGLLGLPTTRRMLARLRETADECLDLVGLAHRATVPAAALPAGDRRLVAIARALATGPDWLLLDEPGAGLNAVEKDALLLVVRKLVERRKTIIFVEHDMSLVGRLAERVLVLDRGKLIADGTPDDVRHEPRVVEAYLGSRRASPRQKASPCDAASCGAAAATRDVLLRVEDISISYGGLRALRNVSLTAAPGEILAIVGPNGAGKSSLLKGVARLIPTEGGSISLAGRPLSKLSAAQVVRAGVSLAPEGRELFGSLSVEDNLSLGSYVHAKGLGSVRFHASQHVQDALEQVFELFPRLRERRGQLAGTLSGGEGQMLAIGRALMNAPRLLLLDEPSLGLAPQVIDEIFDRLVELRSRGLSILLVEQNARAALEIADRALILEVGRAVASGSARDLQTDPKIVLAYLGNLGEGTLAASRGADGLPGSGRP